VLEEGAEHLCGMPLVDHQHPGVQGNIVPADGRYLMSPGSAAQVPDQPQVIDLAEFLFAQIKECTQTDCEQAGAEEVFHWLTETKIDRQRERGADQEQRSDSCACDPPSGVIGASLPNKLLPA
jgi:hypothetical protein